MTHHNAELQSPKLGQTEPPQFQSWTSLHLHAVPIRCLSSLALRRTNNKERQFPPPHPSPVLCLDFGGAFAIVDLFVFVCVLLLPGGGGGSGRHNFQISATLSLSIQLTISFFDEHSSSFHILPLIFFRIRNLFLTKNHPNKLLLSRTSKNRRRIYDWTRQANSPLYSLQQARDAVENITLKYNYD